MTHGEVLGRWVSTFVGALWDAGVREVVISPGSRSTPLSLAFAENRGFRVLVHIDERSAAFFALGIAKASGRPVALVCSSGTAAANYFPAVVEASLSRIPLVVLTADRPHELRDVGAPQSIDQVNLYGRYTRWFVDLPVPDVHPGALRAVRTAAHRAVRTATAELAGPVHVNFPFREPLLPTFPANWQGSRPAGELVPDDFLHQPRHVVDEAHVRALVQLLAGARRPLLICGPREDGMLVGAVTSLAAALEAPLLADPLSQLRSSATHDASELVIDGYDAILRLPNVERWLGGSPDVVLRFGAAPTSKALNQYVEAAAPLHHLVVDVAGSWRDPSHGATIMIHADAVSLCRVLAASWRQAKPAASFDPGWVRSWRLLNAQWRLHIREWLELMDDDITPPESSKAANKHDPDDIGGKEPARFAEGRVVMELQRVLPSGASLMVGNSMPIRDVDSFWQASSKPVRLLANRGANGIDGVVSTALGVAAAGGPTVLLIGDLSFYHDMNGLLAARYHGLNALIVIVNNDGGGIFSFLPQASLESHFEPLFGTPTGLDYEHAAALYGGSFSRPKTWADFRTAAAAALSSGGLHVIEVRSRRSSNVAAHRAMWDAFAGRVEPLAAEVFARHEGGGAL